MALTVCDTNSIKVTHCLHTPQACWFSQTRSQYQHSNSTKHIQEITGKLSCRLASRMQNFRYRGICWLWIQVFHSSSCQNLWQCPACSLTNTRWSQSKCKIYSRAYFYNTEQQMHFLLLFGVITTVKVRYKVWKPWKNTCFITSGSRKKEIQQLRILNARRSKITDCTVGIEKKKSERAGSAKKRTRIQDGRTVCLA